MKMGQEGSGALWVAGLNPMAGAAPSVSTVGAKWGSLQPASAGWVGLKRSEDGAVTEGGSDKTRHFENGATKKCGER